MTKTIRYLGVESISYSFNAHEVIAALAEKAGIPFEKRHLIQTDYLIRGEDEDDGTIVITVREEKEKETP